MGTLIVVSSLSDILIDKYKTGKIGCGEQITLENLRRAHWENLNLHCCKTSQNITKHF